jgi:hypothetical protein
VSYANRKRAKKVNDSSVGNTGDNIEEIESETVNLVAVIKNENRASFIDMVVYNSQTEKTVVYNEGNGAYQCSSETVYEDGMWVTNIGFSVNVELTTDTFYFETKEIKFLRNSADVQVDVNDENIRKKHLAFSDEYLTNTLLNKDFNIKCGEFNVKVTKLHLESKTVEIECLITTKEIDKSYADFEFDISKDIPSVLELEYYQNGEIKKEDFTISDMLIYIDSAIKKLVVNDSVKLQGSIPSGSVEYAEGSKVCSLNLVPYEGYLWIPSTCTEITYDYIGGRNLVYDGTMEEFRNIKGVDEVVLQFFVTQCNDGIVHDSMSNPEEEKKEF